MEETIVLITYRLGCLADLNGAVVEKHIKGGLLSLSCPLCEGVGGVHTVKRVRRHPDLRTWLLMTIAYFDRLA